MVRTGGMVGCAVAPSANSLALPSKGVADAFGRIGAGELAGGMVEGVGVDGRGCADTAGGMVCARR